MARCRRSARRQVQFRSGVQPVSANPQTSAQVSRPPFRADHVGSFLRPRYLIEARDAAKSGTLSAAELRAVEDRAIREVVKLQEEVGLQAITDGEFRRTFFHVDFLTQLDGVVEKGGMQVKFHKADGDIDYAPPVMRVTGK